MGKNTIIFSIFPFLICMIVMVAQAEDPYLFYDWKVTYGTQSPLGAPQQVILINGQFPGPNLNTTTNNNIVLNVFNQLDEPLLFTWYVSLIYFSFSITSINHSFLTYIRANQTRSDLDHAVGLGHLFHIRPN